MRVKSVDKGILILRVILFALFVPGLLVRCANTLAPTGGPRDSLPPVVVNMTPAYGTTNFDQKRIFIEFDEYIKLQDQSKEFFTSPFMSRKPTLLIKGRGVQIEFRDTLPENTTVSLNFGSSIQDNNEGNPLHGFRYVFSTGDYIDSLVMSGYTAEAYSGDSLSKPFILFYEASKDSTILDSTVFLSHPDAVGRSQANGIFIAENLKPVDYRVYALLDNNNNQTYEPGVDMIGFLDTVYNPLHMPPFDIWYDTVRQYMTGEPQLYFRLFMDEQFKRQYLSSQTRPVQHRFELYFGAPFPQILDMQLDNLDTSRLIKEYLTPNRDSIAYWINLPGEEIPDTIRGRLAFIKHDSINNLVPDTVNLSLAWRFIESREQERERLRKEKEVEDAIAQGLEVPQEPNPFKVKVDASATINPEKPIGFEFDYPLVRLDSSRVTLLRHGETEDQRYAVPFSWRRDTTSLLRWQLHVQWQNNQKYSLEIPAGTFENILGEINDTLKSEFSTMDPEKYAAIEMNVKGKTDSSSYVIQLLDNSGRRMLNEIRHVRTGEYVFNFVDPGTVRIRIIEDDNDNGVWDKGNLIKRIQPERVSLYYDSSGESEIATKMNWTLSFDLDMDEIFYPVTMENVVEQLKKAEQAKYRKWLKEKERNQNQYQPSKGQLEAAGNNPFNPASGLGTR